MKPFNLTAALSGEPVVTRNGDKVIRVIHIPDSPIKQKLVVILESNVYFCTETGNCFESENSTWDLFMASTTKTGWINIYRNGHSFYIDHSGVYDSQLDANSQASSDRIACVQVTWEEQAN